MFVGVDGEDKREYELEEEFSWSKNKKKYSKGIMVLLEESWVILSNLGVILNNPRVHFVLSYQI